MTWAGEGEVSKVGKRERRKGEKEVTKELRNMTMKQEGRR